MDPLTRRSLLHGSAGLIVALAGCNELLDGVGGSTNTADRAAQPAGDDPASASETDPDSIRFRADGDRPPVWLANPDRDDGGRPTPVGGDYYIGSDSRIIGDQSRADRIAVAESVDREQVDSFLAATDFEGQTVYLETILVEECFRLDLCRISWQSTAVSTEYSRSLRPYDERCAADRGVAEVRLTRIPDTLDPERVRTYSRRTRSGTCDGGRPPIGEEVTGGTESTDTPTPTESTDTPTPTESTDTPTPTESTDTGSE